VVITIPSAGAQLSGFVVVSASASDNVGVFDVHFRANGVHIAPADYPNSEPGPYGIAWDTVLMPNGAYSLSAVARDAAGNEAASAAVPVTIANDTTRPRVTFANPSSGATVKEMITLSASTEGPYPITAVLYYLDGQHIGSASSAPFSLSWDSTSVANGAHELKALAYDRSGRYGKVTIPVTVGN
jgi:hypothetical protein